MTSPIPESVTESLYKQNLELAIKNKTLSLLKQLYQISILSLEPNILASKIVNIVQDTLGLELVGILTLNQIGGNLVPLKFSISERLKNAEAGLHSLLEELTIPNASSIQFFEKILQNIPNHTENISDVWDGLVPDQTMALLKEQAHIKSISAYPLIIDGKITGVFIICLNRTYDKLSQYEKESMESLVDVTAIALDRARLYQELKIANEKLRELDQLKSEFLSLATHQIRAPLTSIKGYSSMLLESDFGVLPQKATEAIETVMKSCQNLINIVEDFLNISRIEQGRMVYEKSIFDMAELVREVVNEIKPNIQNAGLSLKLEMPDNFSAKANADRGKIRQVIFNIIDNAVKYSTHGTIRVSASADDKTVNVEIKDDGVGIDPSEIGKLFTKFSRAKSAGLTNISGTGLGLYVAKKMAEAHRGDIKVYSAGLGKGSTFTVELPRYE